MKKKALSLTLISIVTFVLFGFIQKKHNSKYECFQKTNCDSTVVYFKQQVMPILQENCVSCHNILNKKDDVSLDTFENIKAIIGTDKTNDFSKNVLAKVIQRDRMPPNPHPKLTPNQKKIILKWIEQGMQNNNCDIAISADATTEITFENHINLLLQNNCVRCHNQSNTAAGIDLTDYFTIMGQTQNGKIFKTISHAEGVVAMPLNAQKLLDSEIEMFATWEKTGKK